MASVLYLNSVVRYLRNAYVLVHFTEFSLVLAVELGDSIGKSSRDRICRDVFLVMLGVHSLVLLR